MKKSNRDYLNDLLLYIERIEHSTQAGKSSFDADYVIQDAVIRQYEVIGEIAKRINPALLDTQPSIDWKSIKGFRDFLAHNYDRVDLNIIWGAVQTLPILRQAVEAMLATLPRDDEQEL
jgi:uncharacterized protein with HEPN domain